MKYDLEYHGTKIGSWNISSSHVITYGMLVTTKYKGKQKMFRFVGMKETSLQLISA